MHVRENLCLNCSDNSFNISFSSFLKEEYPNHRLGGGGWFLIIYNQSFLINHPGLRPPLLQKLIFIHIFLLIMVQKELNFKNYNKDWRLSSAFDRHSPAMRDEVGELVHLAGDSVPRSATNNNI